MKGNHKPRGRPWKNLVDWETYWGEDLAVDDPRVNEHLQKQALVILAQIMDGKNVNQATQRASEAVLKGVTWRESSQASQTLHLHQHFTAEKIEAAKRKAGLLTPAQEARPPTPGSSEGDKVSSDTDSRCQAPEKLSSD